MDTHRLLNLIWIAAGSGLGGMARYGLSGWVARRHGEEFPFGTLAVNVTGAFMIGWLASLPWGTLAVNLAGSVLIGAIAALTGPDGRWVLAPEKRLFLMAGVCGGFTTFSFFSLQTWTLIETGQVCIALLYSLATVVGGVTAAWLSFQTAKRS